MAELVQEQRAAPAVGKSRLRTDARGVMAINSMQKKAAEHARSCATPRAPHQLLGLATPNETAAKRRRLPRLLSSVRFAGAGVGGLRTAQSFATLERDDARRMAMLALSRESDLVFGASMCSNPRSLFSTVIPSLLVAPPTLLAVSAFAGGAALARCEVLAFAREDYDDNALTGASVLVSFLVAFYLGYCTSHTARHRLDPPFGAMGFSDASCSYLLAAP